MTSTTTIADIASKIAGVTNRGAWTSTPTSYGKVTIPAGYHNGSGYVDTGKVYDAGAISGKQNIITFYNAYNEQIGSTWGGQTVTYTATYTGKYVIAGFTVNIGSMEGTAKYTVYVNNVEKYNYTCGSSTGNYNHSIKSISVNKGDIIKMTGSGGSSNGYGYFNNNAYIITLA